MTRFQDDGAGATIVRADTPMPSYDEDATGYEPVRQRVNGELRGDKPGHKFHGNQWHGEVDAATTAERGRQMVAPAYGKLYARYIDPIPGGDGGPSTPEGKAYEAYLGGHQEGAVGMNESMRRGKPNQKARLMLNAMRTLDLRTTDAVTVDRGVTAKHADDIRAKGVGSTVEYRSFISTSYDQGGARPAVFASRAYTGEQLDHATVLRVTVPKGTLYLPGAGHNQELILAPGRMKVTGTTTGTIGTGRKKLPATIVHMTYEESL